MFLCDFDFVELKVDIVGAQPRTFVNFEALILFPAAIESCKMYSGRLQGVVLALVSFNSVIMRMVCVFNNGQKVNQEKSCVGII